MRAPDNPASPHALLAVRLLAAISLLSNMHPPMWPFIYALCQLLFFAPPLRRQTWAMLMAHAADYYVIGYLGIIASPTPMVHWSLPLMMALLQQPTSSRPALLLLVPTYTIISILALPRVADEIIGFSGLLLSALFFLCRERRRFIAAEHSFYSETVIGTSSVADFSARVSALHLYAIRNSIPSRLVIIRLDFTKKLPGRSQSMLGLLLQKTYLALLEQRLRASDAITRHRNLRLAFYLMDTDSTGAEKVIRDIQAEFNQSATQKALGAIITYVILPPPQVPFSILETLNCAEAHFSRADRLPATSLRILHLDAPQTNSLA